MTETFSIEETNRLVTLVKEAAYVLTGEMSTVQAQPLIEQLTPYARTLQNVHDLIGPLEEIAAEYRKNINPTAHKPRENQEQQPLELIE